MSEIKFIIQRVQTNYNNLNDKKRNLAVILSDRRINSGMEGVKVLMSGMTQKLDDDERDNASILLDGLIARKNLQENAKKKATI